MKKSFLVVLILTMSLSMAFSTDIFGLSLGINGSYNQEKLLEDGSEPSILNLDSYSFGFEGRTTINPLLIDAVGEIAILNANEVSLSGILSAGFQTNLFSFFRFGLTLGPKVTYVYEGNLKFIDNEGRKTKSKAFFDALFEGNCYMRFMADIIAGPVMSLGLAYTVPTDFNMKATNFSALLPSAMAFDEGQVTFCIQMKLF
ncbi:MAG: hypothetical protein HUK24_00145 [Sphaerochaetaceae bacterium]|nr:hypothetical protein [Sphaerochaetaceae bacterium]